MKKKCDHCQKQIVMPYVTKESVYCSNLCCILKDVMNEAKLRQQGSLPLENTVTELVCQT